MNKCNIETIWNEQNETKWAELSVNAKLAFALSVIDDMSCKFRALAIEHASYIYSDRGQQMSGIELAEYESKGLTKYISEINHEDL